MEVKNMRMIGNISIEVFLLMSRTWRKSMMHLSWSQPMHVSWASGIRLSTSATLHSYRKRTARKCTTLRLFVMQGRDGSRNIQHRFRLSRQGSEETWSIGIVKTTRQQEVELTRCNSPAASILSTMVFRYWIFTHRRSMMFLLLAAEEATGMRVQQHHRCKHEEL